MTHNRFETKRRLTQTVYPKQVGPIPNQPHCPILVSVRIHWRNCSKSGTPFTFRRTRRLGRNTSVSFRIDFYWGVCVKKHVGKILIGVLLLVVAAVAIWLQFPKVKDPAFYEAAQSETKAKTDNLKTGAQKSEQNGYLDPYMAEWWGRKGLEYKDQSEARTVCYGWQNYSSTSEDRAVDHTALLKAKDKQYLDARAAYEKMLNEHLLNNLSKPFFIAPEENYSIETVFPNIMALRSIVHCNNAYVESLLAEGKIDEAVGLSNLTLEFAAKFSGQLGLLQEMLSGSMARDVVRNDLQVYGSAIKTSPENWLKLAQTALATLPQDHTLESALKTELVIVAQVADGYEGASLSAATEGQLGGFHALLGIPGMAQREKRIYINVMTELIKKKDSKEAQSYVESLNDFGLGSILVGSNSIVSAIAVPNVPKAYDQFNTTRRLQLGFALYAGIRAHQAKSGGKPPKDLSELGSLGLKLPPDIDDFTYEVTGGDKGTLTTTLRQEVSLVSLPQSAASTDGNTLKVSF